MSAAMKNQGVTPQGFPSVPPTGVVIVRGRQVSAEERSALLARMWAKTRIEDESGCWVWQGPRNASGYGLINFRDANHTVSRLSLELDGVVLTKALFACHRCDNPPCWNPAHLWAGTPRENNFDKVSKGRSRVRPKMTAERDEYVWRLYWKGRMTIGQIARANDLSPSTVDCAIQRHEKRCWDAEDQDLAQHRRELARRKNSE